MICLFSEPIVSSNQRFNFPLYIFAYSSFRIMFRAFPIWSGPEGNGASRITTFPFVAFSRGFSPTLISRFEVFVSRDSNSDFCLSGDIELTSFRICWTFGIMFLISDFSKPSAKSPDKTAPWFALPLYFIAFSSA